MKKHIIRDFVRASAEQTRKTMGLLLGGATLLGCPQPQPPPRPDASDASLVGDAPASCTAACANLAAIGCLAGADPKCEAACSTELVPPADRACWAAAKDKAAARACGGLTCP